MADAAMPVISAQTLGNYVTNTEILDKLTNHLAMFERLFILILAASMDDAKRAHLNTMLRDVNLFRQLEITNTLLLSLMGDLRYRFPDSDGK
ncbi:MAG TPA: hypothetical protein VJK04_02645 [Candidatus Paceibacterota bacterium]